MPRSVYNRHQGVGYAKGLSTKLWWNYSFCRCYVLCDCLHGSTTGVTFVGWCGIDYLREGRMYYVDGI